MNGLLGKGWIDFPLEVHGVPTSYHYSGYVFKNNEGIYEARLHGNLWLNGKMQASGPVTDLQKFSPIQNHVFDPSFLQTSNIMTDVNSFNPDHGDLFMPEDMINRIKGANGRILEPVFHKKRLVLMGPMGVGKSSLYTRLTNSTTPTSNGTKTCTTVNSMAHAIGPAKDLLVVDTPGTAASSRNGMSVDQAMELRKGLCRGEVSQIVLAISAPNNTRSNAYCDLLAPFESIFDCNTFRQDANEVDVVMTEGRTSPRRTRAFVVVTHRDRPQDDQRVQMRSHIDDMRKSYPWVGPVAFIDQNVSTNWLYNTIIAFAGYQGQNQTNHTIPLVEMFSQFNISFPPVKNEWVQLIEEAKTELRNGMACIEYQLTHIDEMVEKQLPHINSGKYVDLVAPFIDCLTKATDDMYEIAASNTLAKCYGTEVDKVFDDIDNDDMMNDRLTTLNTIKRDLAGVVLDARKRISSKYPTSSEGAVFKKCTNPKCKAVYMKPTGCNNLGTCGLKAGVKRDDQHNGEMNTVMQYEYNWNNNIQTSLTIKEGKTEGTFEAFAMGLCRKLRKAAEILTLNQKYEHQTYEYIDTTNTYIAGSNEEISYGCGRDLMWDRMIPLTREEMEENGLLPKPSKPAILEPVADIGTMTIDTFLGEKCGGNFRKYIEDFKDNEFENVREILELDWDDSETLEFLKCLIQDKIHRRIFVSKVKELK